MNSAEKNYNIQKHLIAHAQYILNFLDKWQVLDDKVQTLNFAYSCTLLGTIPPIRTIPKSFSISSYDVIAE